MKMSKLTLTIVVLNDNYDDDDKDDEDKEEDDGCSSDGDKVKV